MNSKSRLVFIGHGASRTGAPMSLLNLLRWTRENTGNECIVVLGNRGPLVPEYQRLAAVHLWNAGESTRSSLPARALARLRRMGADDADVTHDQTRIVQALKARPVRCVFNNTGVNGHILAALKPHLAAPVVSRIPELEAYMRKNNRNGSVDRVLALTDHFIAVAAAVKDNLVRRHSIPAERISVVHGASSAKREARGAAGLRQRLDLPPEAFIVGGCGTLDYRKGVDLFIQLAHHCVNRLGRRDLHFCWVGACVSQDSCIEYRFEIEALGLEQHLFLTGEIEDTSALFADLDVFALTSREDPFPLVMIEAARQGLPILCFEGGGGAVEFVNETIGAVLPMLDVCAMAHAVLAMRDEPERQRALGEAAHRRSLAFTPDAMAAAIHRVIDLVSSR